MGFFKRAEWHSGLTYQQECPLCKTTIIYKDDKLDFRPWFADGFVYCPTCEKPLRHNEKFAIDQGEAKVVDLTNINNYAEQTYPKFCTNCGKALNAGDRFCSACGKKVE